MGPRAMCNIAVLDLPNAVELISMLEGLCFGTTHEVTQVVEWIKCISTGRRMQSQRSTQVDFILCCSGVKNQIPNWWTSQMFLGVVYSSILLEKRVVYWS